MATKARFFTALLYPDSAPEDWLDQLKDSLRQYLISPEHRPDPSEDMESGALKTLKPHRHVMYCHGNSITASAAREIMPDWLVVPPSDHAFMVGSYRNLSRYFLHIDQQDKEQFSGRPMDLLTVLNNFPLDLSKELTKDERRQLKIELWNFVRDNNIVEFADLLDALGDAQNWDMFELAFDQQSKIEGYIRSRRHSFKGSAGWE
jgi:hypothetical protein